MPVACLLDLKERTESKDEGARGSAANEVRRKTKSPHQRLIIFCQFHPEYLLKWGSLKNNPLNHFPNQGFKGKNLDDFCVLECLKYLHL